METLCLATFVMALVSSIISGISGGGGGFIMTPYFLLIGLTPQQNIAIGSVMSLGLSGGSLVAMRGRGLMPGRRSMWPLAVITVGVTIPGILLLPRIDSVVVETAVGLLLIAASPTLFINKHSLQPGLRSTRSIYAGYALYGLLLFGNAMFASGLAALLFLPLMFLLGLPALQANAAKRVLGLVQAVLVFAILAPLGAIVWSHALAGLAGAWIGAHIGTRIAIKKGDRWIRFGLAGVMVVSGLILVVR